MLPYNREAITKDLRGIHEKDDLLSVPEVYMANELEQVYSEKEKNRESLSFCLEELDADALLLYQVLESRKGLKGIKNKFLESINSNSKDSTIMKVGKFGLKAAASGVASRSLSMFLKHYLHASAPVVGAVTGGAMGGLIGYVKGRNKFESASQWGKDVGADFDLANIDNISTGELEIALGVINNAIKEGKVRGSALEKVELAGRYRAINWELQRRNSEIQESEKDPALQRIDAAIQESENEGKAISEMAGGRAEIRELYEKALGEKNKKIVASAIKGGLVGAGFGFVVNWAGDKLFHGGVGGEHGGHGDSESTKSIIEAKKEAAKKIHESRVNLYEKPGTGGLQPGDKIDPGKLLEQLQKLKEAGVDFKGFSDSDLSHFSEMVKNSASMDQLKEYAAKNFINLGECIDSHTGQTLGQFIAQNKEAFLHLSSESQRQILSYPDLAKDILKLSAGHSKEAAIALTTKVAGGIGLLGFLGGFGLANRSQKKTDKETYRIFNEAKKEAKDENRAWGKEKAEQEKIKQEEASVQATAEQKEAFERKGENIEKSKEKLKDSVISFVNLKELDSDYAKYYPKKLMRMFRVKEINEDGFLIFDFTESDRAILKNERSARKRNKIHPKIHLNMITNENGVLDTSKVHLIGDKIPVEQAEDLINPREEDEQKAEEPKEEESKEKLKSLIGKEYKGKVVGFGNGRGKILVEGMDVFDFKTAIDSDFQIGQEINFEVLNVEEDRGNQFAWVDVFELFADPAAPTPEPIKYHLGGITGNRNKVGQLTGYMKLAHQKGIDLIIRVNARVFKFDRFEGSIDNPTGAIFKTKDGQDIDISSEFLEQNKVAWFTNSHG